MREPSIPRLSPLYASVFHSVSVTPSLVYADLSNFLSECTLPTAFKVVPTTYTAVLPDVRSVQIRLREVVRMGNRVPKPAEAVIKPTKKKGLRTNSDLSSYR